MRIIRVACALCLVAAPARAAFAPRVPLHARARHRPLCRLATHARACATRPSADDAEPGPRGAGADGATAADEELNLLQTQLFAAIADEDYARACTLRDRIAASAGDASDSAWDAHDVPDWLSDWLGRLRFGAPTRVQLNALRAMGSDGDRDLVISAPTGSGKTLAYLLPALTALSDQLMQEDLGDYLQSALDGRRRGPRRRLSTDVPTPVVMVVVPTRELGVQVSLLAYRLLGGGATNPTLQPFSHPSRHTPGNRANMFSYQGPRHARVAGIWEDSAVYAAAYQDLLKDVHLIVGTPDHLSRVAISGNLRLQNVRTLVIDEADATLADKQSTPLLRRFKEAREKAKADADAKLKVWAEGATAAAREGAAAEAAAGAAGAGGDDDDAVGLLPLRTVLVGASLSARGVQRAIDAGWVSSPLIATERGIIPAEKTAEKVAEESSEAATASDDAGMAWRARRVPAGQRHEYMITEQRDALATLCRLLRSIYADTLTPSKPDPPRVVVFCDGPDAAVDVATRLQAALWSEISGDSVAGLWGLSVLLPSAEARHIHHVFIGVSLHCNQRKFTDHQEPLLTRNNSEGTMSVLESSLRVMEMFRANQTSVLVTTPLATRGLDFPAVTHVLNLGIIGGAADYVHRAGRVGRIGQQAAGAVVSIVSAAEEGALLDLGRELEFTPQLVEPPNTTPVEDDEVQALEDLFNLYEAEEAPAADQ